MKAFSTWLRSHLWAAFLIHQAGLFLIALGFLSSVRRITGRDVHLGKDPIGLGDGTAAVVLSVGVILLTRVFYRWVKGNQAPSLGLGLTPRRSLDLVIGILIGFLWALGPWLVALWLGTAAVYDRITTHFDSFSVARILTVAFLMLLLQALMEETANRAFPMKLWEHRSLAFRLVVPSIFFIAIHLVSEPFSFERIGVLFTAGLLFGFAYLLTGNVWLASGLHAGGNIAGYSISGLWHDGAVVALTGRPTIPYWTTGLIMLGVFSVAYVLLQRYQAKSPAMATEPVNIHPPLIVN
jgi:membrane protease YdiL (CAAX protease family)